MAVKCDTPALDNPLWEFALHIYQQAGVAELCLQLQDDHQQDVLLLLSSLWLATQQHAWADDLMAFDDYRQWRAETIQPIRVLRRSLDKSNTLTQPLRRQLQTSEIEAERVGLGLIHQALKAQIKERPQLHARSADSISQATLAQKNLMQILNMNKQDIKKEAVAPLFQSLIERTLF